VRVVAGIAGGRVLRAPEGRATRPTSDRVREAVFSILSSADAVEGSTVLDLFAGSGALGIEALSRGAVKAVFIDADPAAVRTIRANLTVVGDLAERATVLQTDALGFAASAAFADVVFADPPYRFDQWPDLLARLGPRTGTLVAEAASELDPGPAWETMKVKRYGGTVVTVARPLNGPEVLVAQEGDI
jgi:16S rRNA (guanine966-N2)-methyltransferase